MNFPELTPIPSQKLTIDTFRGYNCNLRIGAGEFCEMENLTSDGYPVLTVRRGRSLYANPASPQGLIAKEQLCYVDGGDFVLGDTRVEMNLSTAHEDNPKQLLSMGAYVLIFPDKVYINTVDLSDRGSMEASFTAEQTIFSLCDGTNGDLTPDFIGKIPPEAPQNGCLWLDTSAKPGSLKQWAQTPGVWNPVLSTFVKLTAPGIGKQFRENDGITISGLSQVEDVKALEGSAVIRCRGEDYLVIPGLLAETITLETPVTVERKVPNMDFLVESGNRLWGCRYGTDDSGETVNRIYASKLGDFRNWNCFMGLSTDSYYANIGTDGPFTGAAAHMGTALFFKENCLHKVYGLIPSEFTVQDTPCRGVQPGCSRSLAIVGENLLYKSRTGICLYDGSLPREISYALGSSVYDNAVAGSHGGKYYISMRDSKGWHLFVYDTVRNLWHREDAFHAACFASFGQELYAIDADANRILGMLGCAGSTEGPVHWMAQTGELGLRDPDMQYISRIHLRLRLGEQSKLHVYAQYDESQEWIHLADIAQCNLRSFSVPIRPRRSDYLRLKLVGEGDCRLYAMTKTIEKGSELS